MSLSVSHWSRLYGDALGSATLKQEMHDFIVEEQLGFEPSGEGEHIFLWLEKTNLNTAFVAESLAKFSNLHLRDITYAGRKDKFALTRQWFGVHIANKQEPNWDEFDLEGAKILKVARNDRKLRVGVLKGNRFELTLRNLTANDDEKTEFNIQALEERLALIKQHGAPNYYGSQRFGEMRITPTESNEAAPDNKVVQGGNLALAEKLVAGEAIRNRNKRSMAISALRSWLFNQVIHERIERDCFLQPLLGDAMQLSGSNSFFVFNDDAEKEKIIERLSENDINITAPLWGDGKLHSDKAAKALEVDCVKQFPEIIRTLNSLGLKQERRAIRIVPQDFTWQIENKHLKMQFSLPAGCFATSIVRELLDV
ncbi:tRNA pseudouridine(13) synthase TruD [Glaciecola sp. MF2-115]|uniref:tRNA pseudouridine(13) synthase TruD n=1 Tax=Glaciecola sp. MF2-115 TaxID=3384827 RepID=UPI0039A0364F